MNLILSIVISILSFGAVAERADVNNAGAINQAIEACAKAGGGFVDVPRGTFYTGSIYLQSGVRLRLADGAVLMGSPRLDDYAPLRTQADLSRYESGQGTVNYNSATDPEWSRAMIFAVGLHDAGIEGPGTIDGADVRNPRGEEHMRGPHTVMVADCERMTFSGFQVRRSANYAFLAYQISRSSFTDLHVEGGWDGIHIRGAERVDILRCDLHTGDDAIAGGYWNRTRIVDCTLNSSCNGIRMIMPSTRVDVTRCHIYGPGQFEHITSHRTRSEAAINIEPGAWGKAPGRLDRISISHCRVDSTLTPLSVTLGDDNTAGRITVDHLVARGITRMALSVKSWGTAPTDCVRISHADLEFTGIDDPALPDFFKDRPFSEWPVFPCWGMYFRNVGSVSLSDVTLRVAGKDYREAVMTDNVARRQWSPKDVTTVQ